MEKRGFTLIELLIVVAILAVLIGATIVAINPFEQLSAANNATRWAGITTIMNAVSQNIIDHGGIFEYANCTTDIPTTATNMAASGGYDICPCIASNTAVATTSYVGMIPVDPTAGTQAPDLASPCVGYDTGYTIIKDTATGRITITAPSAQLDETISISR